MGSMPSHDLGVAPHRLPGRPLTDIAASAVNVFDAVAQLESQGYNDHRARQLGHLDLMTMAGDLTNPARTITTPRWALADKQAWPASFQRALVLVAGVIMCVLTLSAGTSEAQAFISGAIGWAMGQAVAGGLWYALGRGRKELARSAALTSMLPAAGIALAVAVVLQTPSPLLWGMWGLAISTLVVLRLDRKLAAIVAGQALLSLIAWHLSPVLGRKVAALMIVWAFGWSCAVLWRQGARFALVPPRVLRAQLVAGLQASGLIAVLLMILFMIGPDGFFLVALSGLAAAVVADPLLDAMGTAARRIADATTSWPLGNALEALLGLVTITVLVAFAGLVALGLEAVLLATVDTYLVFLSIALIATATAGAGFLLRSGSSIGAMLLSTLLAVLSGLAWLLTGADVLDGAQGGLTALALISTVSALTLAVRYASSPTSW